MGDFNPNIPNIVGLEDFITQTRTVDLASAKSGMAMQVNPGAVTPTGFGVYENQPVNSARGVELVSTLTPALVTETIFPGTDTGAYTASGTWTNEDGSAAAFGRIAKNNDDSTYLQLTSPSALMPAGVLGWGYQSLLDSVGELTLGYRFGRATNYTSQGQRVVSVTVNVRAANNNTSYKSLQFALGRFGSAGQPNTIVSPAFKLPANGKFYNYSYNLTGDPWTLATVNAAIPFWSEPHRATTWDSMVTTGGPYTIGLVIQNPLGSGASAAALQISGLWLTVTYAAAENRQICAYPRSFLKPGWNKLGGGTHFCGSPAQRAILFTSNAATTALTTPAKGSNGCADFTAADVGATIVRASDGQVVGTVQSVTNYTTAVLTANGASTNTSVLGYLGTAPAALTASTFYYVVQDSLPTAPNMTSQVGLIRDAAKVVLAAPGSAGENRQCWALGMAGGAPYVPTSAVAIPGELMPLLIYTGLAATTVHSESQPYTTMTFSSEVRSGQSVGQQATTTAATLYGAVRLVVGRNSILQDPDLPLAVDIRHGAGALGGGGTLDATTTVPVSALNAKNGPHKYTAVSAQFAVAFTSILNTQYVIYARSGATKGRGWTLALCDSSSGLVTGVTTADVEGATVGGTVDGYDQNGTVSTRYDIPAAIVAPPTAPAGFTATPVAAT